MTIKFIRVAILSLAVLITPSLKPISVGMAQGISVAVGAGSGLAIGLGMHYYGKLHPALSGVGGVLGGAAIGTAAYFILYEYTPEGRTARANKKMNRILMNPMSTHYYINEKDFFDALQSVYVVHDLWLIGAFRELSSLLQDAYDVVSLVEQVKAESDNYGLIQQCEALKPKARMAIANITKAIKTIRENKEYVEQLKIQKEQEMRERELAVAQQQAQAAQANAMAQMSMAHSQAQMVNVKRERNDIEGIKAATRIAAL